MDILDLLTNATIIDTEGYDLGDTFAFHVVQGQNLVITVDTRQVEDPDDGEKDDIPESEGEAIMRVVSGG